jgi:hypothetical protein
MNFKELNLTKYENLMGALDALNIEMHGNQICLNAPADDTSNHYRGCGSLYYDWDNADTDENGEIINLHKFKNPLAESDFTTLCDVFTGTVFEDLYNMLSDNYTLGRVRIINISPKHVMSWHIDDTSRLHYPIKTQEGCFMVIKDEVLHLGQDQWYWANTILPHTAFNASKENRYHLVATLQ